MLCYGLIFVMWCDPPRPVAAVACPQIEAWPPQFQQQLANELRHQPAGSALLEEARQHLRLRERVRRCKGAR